MIKHCPTCNRTVLPTVSGHCPACKAQLAKELDIQPTAPSTADVARSNPFHLDAIDIERMRAEDRVISRLRFCWLLPLILVVVDFILRQVIFQFFTVKVLEAWFLICCLAGLTTLGVALVFGGRREARSVPETRGHRFAGILVSVIFVAWIGVAYYSLKQLQERGREIYQRQLRAHDLKDG